MNALKDKYRPKRKEAKKRYEKRLSERRSYARLIWYMTHPEEVSGYHDLMASRFADRKRLKKINRRAREKGALGRISKGLYDALMVRQGGRCANCGETPPTRLHRDHIIPLAKGGTNEDSNIQLLCPPCNWRKSDNLPTFPTVGN